MKFCILDIETTGFSPKSGDKILEVAIICIDRSGAILETFETLINPQRDISKSSSDIHGIYPNMIAEAPTIESVIHQISKLIDGSIIVAHNASFDMRFINHVLIKEELIDAELKAVCTLNLSKELLPHLPSFKLQHLCSYLDVEHTDSHSAMGDAKATKEVFHNLVKIHEEQYGVGSFEHYVCSMTVSKPKYKASAILPHTRNDASFSISRQSNRLEQMLARLPVSSIPEIRHIHEYLHTLDIAMLDRNLSQSEIGELFNLASEFGLSRETVNEIHTEYLRRLVRVYLLDNVLTNSEMEDLVKVAEMLSLSSRLALMIEFERSALKTTSPIPKTSNTEYVGKSVCFTGELNSNYKGKKIDRQLAHELSLEKGMIIKSSVSKSLDFLVIADPQSQSNKAKKARELNVKLLAEPVFWQLLNVEVD